jgi:hypothetical protein
VGALVGFIYRSALKRGTTGGHWAWYVVALGAIILRRDRDRRSAPVVQVPISPGERVLVTMRRLSKTTDA